MIRNPNSIWLMILWSSFRPWHAWNEKASLFKKKKGGPPPATYWSNQSDRVTVVKVDVVMEPSVVDRQMTSHQPTTHCAQRQSDLKSQHSVRKRQTSWVHSEPLKRNLGSTLDSLRRKRRVRSCVRGELPSVYKGLRLQSTSSLHEFNLLTAHMQDGHGVARERLSRVC